VAVISGIGTLGVAKVGTVPVCETVWVEEACSGDAHLHPDLQKRGVTVYAYLGLVAA